MASVALAAALALGGCDTDSAISPSLRSLQPLSDKMVAEIEQKNMTKESPILVRLYKEEAELEVWKQDQTGRYALLKTYPICRWSGELGPKVASPAAVAQSIQAGAGFAGGGARSGGAESVGAPGVQRGWRELG